MYRPLGESDYRSYLLRIWREEERWFFSLEAVSGDRRRRGFLSLEALTTFLEEQMQLGDDATNERISE